MQCGHRFKYIDLENMQKQTVPSPMPPLSPESHCTPPLIPGTYVGTSS